MIGRTASDAISLYNNDMVDDIHPADLRLRRKLLIGLLLALAPMAVALPWVRANPDALQLWLGANLEWIQASFVATGSLILLLFSPFLLFAASLFVTGRRALSQQRLPLAGATVLRDTKIVRGPAAIRRGWLLQCLALLLLIMIGVAITLLVGLLFVLTPA